MATAVLSLTHRAPAQFTSPGLAAEDSGGPPGKCSGRPTRKATDMNCRPLLAAGLLLACSLACAQKITSFETPEQMAVLSPSGLQAEQVKEHATDGLYALRVAAKGSDTDSWPGLTYVPANPDLSAVAILTLDTFNPQDFPVTMSFRLDDAAGKTHFASSNVPPGQGKVELWLTSLKFDLDMKRVAKIYPYFSKPRRDVVLFLDNVRFEAMSARFHAMIFQETNPELEYSEQDAANGYVVFARHWLSTVFPSSRPLAHELHPRLATFGCPGQTLPVTFAVHALQDLGQTTVAGGELVSGKDKLPADALRIYPVSTRHKRLEYSSDYYIKDMPTLLERRESVPIPKGRTQLFWINVALPAGTPAGLYEGKVTVRPAQGQPVEVPLQVRVLPYALAEPKHMFFGEYYTKPSFVKTPAETRARIGEELADQRAHGMTSVGLCFGLEDDEFKVEGANVTIAPKPDGLYTKFMETYKALGFPMPVVQLTDTGQTAAAKQPFGSPEYVALYKNFWIACAKLHQERGWPELFVQPVDEPAWQGPDERARNVACLKWLKEIPGQRTEQDGPIDAYFIHEAGPFSDMWNSNGALPKPDVMKQAQAEGRIVVSYNNDVESYRPEMGRYCNGFYQLRSGARGTFNWAYVAFAGNPYDDLDAKTGSWMHFYHALPELGEVGGPSTGWEGARAGVDDFKYAYTLRRAIVRAEQSRSSAARRAAKAGQQALADVVAGLRYDPQTRGTARFAEELPVSDGTKTLHGSLKVPNGWDFEMYDKARWQIASATLDILAALGDIRVEGTLRVPESGTRSVPATRDFLDNVNWSRRPAERAAERLSVQKQVAIPVVDAPPACDGDLSDAVWQKAVTLDPFVRMEGDGAPGQQTIVRLCADGANLYVGAEMLEENIANLTARVAHDGGPVWEDDCLEVFFDPTFQRKDYVQIVINSLAKVYWNNPRDKSWQPPLLRGAKVDRDQRRWTVELGIPLASLGLTSNVFGFNVCRERRPLESLELSCWSPTGQGFAQPQRFGVAAVGGSYLSDFKIGRGVLGANELTATIRNDGKAPHNFLVIADWRQGKRVALYRQKGPIALEPGKQQTVTLPYEVIADGETLALRLTVKDADTGRAYAERSLQQQILPALRMTLRPHLYYLSDEAGQLQVDINLDDDLQDRAALTLALFEAGGTKPVRSQTVPVDNERLDAALNVAGLPAGTYRFEAILKSSTAPGAGRLATQKATITKVPGPF